MPDRHLRSARRRSRCSVLFLFLAGSPRFLVSLSVALADGDGQCVVTAGAQGPVLGIVGKDDAVGAQPVDQRRRAGGTSHLAKTAVAPAWCHSLAGEQDGDRGQVR